MLATATVAALLAATVATASAAPTRAGEEAGPGPGAAGQLVDVVCFNTPHQWNVAVDGPAASVLPDGPVGRVPSGDRVQCWDGYRMHTDARYVVLHECGTT